jgi:ATP-dependent DNA helicase RecG
MRETKTLEFKEDVTNSFLKTVSAFANYGGGTVLFGVDDDGTVVGIDDPVKKCLDIENKVNDSISPRPDYTLDIREADSVIELRVSDGPFKPYLYHSKAYRRGDSSTVEVDTVELTRLILAGRNVNFEQLPAHSQSLTFERLGTALKARAGLTAFNEDTLRTLDLLSNETGYNNAAAILADANDVPGIDISRFGESINVITRRVTSEGVSVLAQLDEAVAVYEDCYCYEAIQGTVRTTVEKIPREAFREAIANAIVHRTWDVSARIRVAMFDDRIEVSSPGGLPAGISEKEYLTDMVSVRRNPILANVFYRLGIIESFGTGILRIKASYAGSVSAPRFTVGDNSITVVLPVLKEDLGLTSDQQAVLDLLSPVRAMAISELNEKVPFGRSKLGGILKDLVGQGLVETVGAGRGLKYRKAKA